MLEKPYPQIFFRVTHETNEHVGEETEPFKDPGANDLCAGVGGRHQYPGVYYGGEHTIQGIYALEKQVGVLRTLGGVKKVNEVVQ